MIDLLTERIYLTLVELSVSVPRKPRVVPYFTAKVAKEGHVLVAKED